MRLAVRIDDFFDAPDEPALQFLLILQAFALHERLAIRAVLPSFLRHFVAADVNVFSGKQLRHFRQHIAKN